MMDWHQLYNTKAAKSMTKADTQYQKLQDMEINGTSLSEADIMDLNEQFSPTSQGFEGATEYTNVSGGKLIIPKTEPSSLASSILLSALSAQILFLSERLSIVEAQLKELNEELQNRPIIRNTNLWELNSEKYRLTHPINIVIEEYPDETVARWPEVEAFGSGTTEAEAIAILKQDIVSLFEDLVTSLDDEL